MAVRTAFVAAAPPAGTSTVNPALTDTANISTR